MEGDQRFGTACEPCFFAFVCKPATAKEADAPEIEYGRLRYPNAPAYRDIGGKCVWHGTNGKDEGWYERIDQRLFVLTAIRQMAAQGRLPIASTTPDTIADSPSTHEGECKFCGATDKTDRLVPDTQAQGEGLACADISACHDRWRASGGSFTSLTVGYRE